MPGERIGAAVGDLVDAEAIVALKDLMAALGSRNLECAVDGAALDASRPDFWRFNTTIAGIDGGGRAAHRRQQSAAGSAGAQRAHPPARRSPAPFPWAMSGRAA